MSRFYLRHFADGNDRVVTVELPGDRSYTQSVDNASVRNDYYTALGHDGEETDSAERAFNQIEGPASEAWRQVAHGVWPLPTMEREVVAGWAALQVLRGTGARTTMNDLANDLLQMQIVAGGRAALRGRLRELGEPDDDESVTRQWIDLFTDGLPCVDVNANHHLVHIASMLPRITRSLLERWWILTTFERKGLATSDHPVYVVPNPEHLAVGMGTGIENADVIHVPLTRRHSLAMYLRSTLSPDFVRHADADWRQPGVTATAIFSNSCTVNSARRVLFHHPEDDPLNGLKLYAPRTREFGVAGDPWSFMPVVDRQVLLDAGLQPPES